MESGTLGDSQRFGFKNFSLGFLIDYKGGGVLYSGTNQSAYGNGMHKETLVGREEGLSVSGVDDEGTPTQTLTLINQGLGLD